MYTYVYEQWTLNTKKGGRTRAKQANHVNESENWNLFLCHLNDTSMCRLCKRIWQSSKGEYCSRILLLCVYTICARCASYAVYTHKCMRAHCIRTVGFVSARVAIAFIVWCAYFILFRCREYHFDWSCTCSDLMACLFYCTFQPTGK